MLDLNAMSRATMIQATAALNGFRAGWMSKAVVAGRSAKLTPHHGDDQSNDPRYGVVAGLLAKHQDSLGVLIAANGVGRSSPSIFRDAGGNVLEFDLDDLVHTAVAVFRDHPHINNVLTHVCGGKWERIGQALHIILNPLATLNDLSPLAQNIVELMCAERGVTGRILKPYFHALLAKVLPPRTAAHLRTHVSGLLLEMQARHAVPLSLSQGSRRTWQSHDVERCA